MAAVGVGFPSRFWEGSRLQWERYANRLLPAGTAEGRCFACLTSAHKWNSNFTNCPESCHFCGTPFLSEDGHFVAECASRPASKAAILEALDNPCDE